MSATIEAEFANFVRALPAVSALVGTRVWQLKFPQSATWPAVRVLLQDDPVLYTHDGPNGLRRALLQADTVAAEASGADPYANVSDLADALDAGVTGYVGPMGASSPAWSVRGVFRTARMATYDPDEVRVVRIVLLYAVWYRPST